jgi:aryl-alcohol dehydrogenase (NADP+)
MHAIDDSLRRLGTDYVDLYQIHRYDAQTPIEETLEALHDVVKSGKARYLGASSMFAWQFTKMLYTAEAHGWTRFVTMQNHYNLLYREEEREMIPLCVEERIGVIPWSPLARGLLAGRRPAATARAKSDTYTTHLYGERIAEADAAVIAAVQQIADGRGLPPAQIALAWLLRKPAVVAPIVGASKPQHIEDAVAAVSVSLSADEIAALEAPYQPHAVAGI